MERDDDEHSRGTKQQQYSGVDAASESGRARERVRTRTKTPREIALLFAPAFPNELFWKVMTYWNPRY